MLALTGRAAREARARVARSSTASRSGAGRAPSRACASQRRGRARISRWRAALPLLPVSSLLMLAQRAWRKHGCERSLICVDARMGEVYWSDSPSARRPRGHRRRRSTRAPRRSDAPAAGRWAAVGNGFGATPQSLRLARAGAASALPERLPLARDLFPQAARPSGGPGCGGDGRACRPTSGTTHGGAGAQALTKL